VKADALAHEVLLTRVCLKLHAARVLRGPRVTHRDLWPDAEVWAGGRLFFLELDRGTMTYAQLARRYAKYIDRPEFVLWVCSTAERRDGMRARAEAIRSTALFATLADALVDPHAAVWADFGGNRVALPRE
jgi:phage gp46-like protein